MRSSILKLTLATTLAGCVVPAYRFDGSADGAGETSVADGATADALDGSNDGAVVDATPDAPPAVDALDADPEAAVEAGLDAIDEPATEAGAPDAVEADAVDVVDALDAPDAIDVADVIAVPDVPDVIDAADVVDVADVIDVVDVVDVVDVIDVVDAAPDPTAPIACSLAAAGSCTGVGVATRLSPLAGLSAASTRPTLRWTLPAGAVGSVVRICSDPRCAVEPPPALTARVPAPPGGAGVSQFTPPALPPRVYYWSVRALFTVPAEPMRPVYADASDAQPWPLVVRANRDPDPSTRAYCQRGFYTAPAAARPEALVGAFTAGASEVHRLTPPTTGSPGAWTAQPHMASTAATSYGANAAIASGDVNCDGVVDTVIGAPDFDSGRGAVFVLSGATNTVTRVASTDEAGAALGASVAAGGDVTGDGCGDIVAGMPGSALRRGAIVLLRGAPTGPMAGAPQAPPPIPMAPAFAWVSTPNALYGASVAILGDVDGDAIDDVAVGAPTTGAIGGVAAPGNGGGAVIFTRGSATGLSGATAVLGVDGAASPNARFGAIVRPAGDLNGDALPDAAIGAPGLSIVIPAFGTTTAPYFSLGSSGTATLLYRWGMAGQRFGDVLTGCLDLNGDGIDEIIASARGSTSYALVLTLGADAMGAPAFGAATGLMTTAPNFGAAFASVGDGDGDGREDLLILDPEASPQAFYARGSAMFFSAPTALPLPAPVPASFGVAASP